MNAAVGPDTLLNVITTHTLIQRNCYATRKTSARKTALSTSGRRFAAVKTGVSDVVGSLFFFLCVAAVEI